MKQTLALPAHFPTGGMIRAWEPRADHLLTRLRAALAPRRRTPPEFFTESSAVPDMHEEVSRLMSRLTGGAQ